MRSYRFALLSGVLLALGSFAFAASGFSQLSEGMNSVCGQFMTILPPLSILLVVVAAVFYGSGKLMPNAEFTTRATNMAAGALVGAVMCIIIVLLVPAILQSLYGGTFSCGTQVWG